MRTLNFLLIVCEGVNDMEQPEIVVNTTMSKEDYRKFLYIATFKRNKIIIPLLVLISLVASLD